MTSDTQTIRHLQQETIRLRSENSSLRDYVERLQRALRSLVSLQQSVQQLRPNTNVFQYIHHILSLALDAVDSENGSLALLDEETEQLVYVEVIGDSREKLLNFRLDKGRGIAGWCVHNRRARLVEDTRREPQFAPEVDQKTGMLTSSLICVPLLDGDRPLGAISVVNTRTGRPFNEDDKEIMIVVGQLAAMAIVAAEKIAS